MQNKVVFEKKWTEEDIQNYMKNPDDVRYDDYNPYDLMELYALADIRKAYPEIDLETLQKMASFAIATAIEDNFADVHERYVSYHDVRHSLQSIIDKSAQ